MCISHLHQRNPLHSTWWLVQIKVQRVSDCGVLKPWMGHLCHSIHCKVQKRAQKVFKSQRLGKSEMMSSGYDRVNTLKLRVAVVASTWSNQAILQYIKGRGPWGLPLSWRAIDSWRPLEEFIFFDSVTMAVACATVTGALYPWALGIWVVLNGLSG